MRTYYALYNPFSYTWSVVWTTAQAKFMQIYIPEVPTEQVAQDTAKALNGGTK